MNRALAAALATTTCIVALATPAAAQTREYSIPAGSLKDALDAYARQSGRQVVYRADQVRAARSPGARGSFSTEAALSALLANSGFTSRVDGQLIAIVRSGNGAASSSAAMSRDGETAAAAASAVGGEIVVTATRRPETALDVPLSIVALSEESLEKSNIKSIADLSTIVPGIDYDANSLSAFAPGSSSIAIRGVISNGGESTTGIYLDDVAMQGTRVAGTTFGSPYANVFDLDRVEVLRGPQGTLFGAGAMGGAIRFIQNQPDLGQWRGRAVGEVGIIDGGGAIYETGAMLNAPVVEDRLGFRASVWRRAGGGYIDRLNPFTGDVVDENSNSAETITARAALAWQPSDSLRITPAINWQKSDIDDTNVYYLYLSDSEDNDFNQGALQALPVNDRWYVPTLTVEADLGFADFTSATSYFRRKADSVGDVAPQFGARAPIFAEWYGRPELLLGYGNPLGPALPTSYDQAEVQRGTLNRRTFAQEVRLSSNDPGAPLQWTVGAYYQNWRHYETAAFSGTPFDLFALDPSAVTVKQEQLSGFVQFDLTVTDGLKLLAGARVDDIKTRLSSGIPDQAPSFVGVQNSTPITPKFGIEYEFTPENMVYATASKGFRAGGANQPIDADFCGTAGEASYGPDTIWSYEVGTKNRLLDGRVTLSASAYLVDWSKIQTDVVIASCGYVYTTNAATARIKGVDGAISALLTPGLRADFSFAYIDGEYTEDVTAIGGDDLIVVEGYPIGSSAPFTMTAALEYAFDLFGNESYIRAENAYRGSSPDRRLEHVPGNPSYNPDLKTNPSYNVLNLRMVSDFGPVKASLYVTNLLNEHPELGWTNYTPGGTFAVASTIQPRTFGINLDYSF